MHLEKVNTEGQNTKMMQSWSGQKVKGQTHLSFNSTKLIMKYSNCFYKMLFTNVTNLGQTPNVI